LRHLIDRLDRTISAGFIIKDGIVEGDYLNFLEHKHPISTEMPIGVPCWYYNFETNVAVAPSEELLEKKQFVTDEEIEHLFKIYNLEFYMSVKELRRAFNQMDGSETISCLIDLYHFGFKQKEVDFSKALIFVIGNLDETY